MSGRRRGEQHCHMQYEKRDKTVRLCTKTCPVAAQHSLVVWEGVRRLQRVKKTPTRPCHAMPCHANLHACDPERAEHPIGSVGL